MASKTLREPVLQGSHPGLIPQGLVDLLGSRAGEDDEAQRREGFPRVTPEREDGPAVDTNAFEDRLAGFGDVPVVPQFVFEVAEAPEAVVIIFVQVEDGQEHRWHGGWHGIGLHGCRVAVSAEETGSGGRVVCEKEKNFFFVLVMSAHLWFAGPWRLADLGYVWHEISIEEIEKKQ